MAKNNNNYDSVVSEDEFFNNRGERRTYGFLTDTDLAWLRISSLGNFSMNDWRRKQSCKQGIAAAMSDIDYLLRQDFESIQDLPRLPELFNGVKDYVGLSPEKCATNLIALAYIITNDRLVLNYGKIVESIDIHPAERSDGPLDPENESDKGGPVTLDVPVDNILAFRNALTNGIRRGKTSLGEPAPDRILIDSNTKLYRELTWEDLPSTSQNDDDLGIDMDDVRDTYLVLAQSAAYPGYDTPDKRNTDRKNAFSHLKAEIELSVANYLTRRRQFVDPEVQNREAKLDASIGIDTHDFPLPENIDNSDTNGDGAAAKIRDELITQSQLVGATESEVYEAVFTEFLEQHTSDEASEDDPEKPDDDEQPESDDPVARIEQRILNRRG